MFFPRQPTVVEIVRRADTSTPVGMRDLYDQLSTSLMSEIGAEEAMEDDVNENSLALFPLVKLDSQIIHLLHDNWGIVNFKGVDLSDIRFPDSVNLSGLWFSDAVLRKAFLQGADLSNSHFERADFSDADLYEANLSGACLVNTIFHNTDLTNVTITQNDIDNIQCDDIANWENVIVSESSGLYAWLSARQFSLTPV